MPLMLCSLVGGFIIFERLFALRRVAIIPAHIVGIVEGSPSDGDMSSLGRIIAYWKRHEQDEGVVRAYARLEVNRMERAPFS